MKLTSLPKLAEEQLALAREAQSGRSAHTIHGGHDQALRQTVLALLGGRELAEHASPGEATLLVLRGRVQLHTAGTSWEGRHGDLLIVPQARHSLEAIDDAVVLLTVAK